MVDFFSEENVPRLRGVPFSADLNKHLYENYYLKKMPKDISDSLEAIQKYYGTKTFVPRNTTDGQADDILREFHAWNKGGVNNVNHEKMLDYTDYDRFLWEEHAAGFASPKNFIRCKGEYVKIRQDFPVLRHEKMHRNDELRSSLFSGDTSFGKFGTKEQFDFTEGGKLLTEKTFYRNELQNAGIPEWHINYAYTNRAEFLAVAAEGDVTKYSEEFKKVLVELGMPDWFFGIRKFKSYN